MNRRGFTLLEVLMAITACAVILAAIYGIFFKAIGLRDKATERVRDVRVQAHAAQVLRNDLRNALVSGGKMAAVLTGSRTAPETSFPGYLKFITTTAPDVVDELRGELQEVAFYVVADPEAAVSGERTGLLVRAVEHNLLATVREDAIEEPLLRGVEAIEVAFYDGTDWQESWEVTTDAPTLPQGVRVRIQSAAERPGEPKPPAIEVVVPWTTQPAIET